MSRSLGPESLANSMYRRSVSYLAVVGLITASAGRWLVNARPGKSLHPPTTDVR
jgi:hypothetical protein